MVEFDFNSIVIFILILFFGIFFCIGIYGIYDDIKKYKKFFKDLKIGDKFYAGTLTYDNPFDGKEDEDIFFEIIDLKYNQRDEIYAKVKWSDNTISIIYGDKIYWEYTKIY